MGFFDKKVPCRTSYAGFFDKRVLHGQGKREKENDNSCVTCALFCVQVLRFLVFKWGTALIKCVNE